MRKILLSLVFLSLASGAFAQQRSKTQEVVPQSQAQVQLSFAPIVKRTSPAVVNVFTKTVIKQRGGVFDDPVFRQLFGEDAIGIPKQRVQNSLGSGVIVDSNGLIITNNHVVKGATDIQVVLSDRREFEAKFELADEKSDLAVLRINTKGEPLSALRLADSDNIEIGDLVLAIGNPFGVGQTVTSGIVSALARTQVGVTDYQFFIQTDAAINPGNSGGALVNMNGELIGINTAIYSRSGGSIGIGFSVPSNMVQTVIQSAEAGSILKRPWLGGEFQDVTADIADSLGFARPEGALITGLNPQSPLTQAGLRRGDVIVAVDGRSIESAQELGYRAATARIGETRIFEFMRGRRSFQANVKMLAAPESTPRNTTVISGGSPLSGLEVSNLSPAVAEELRIDLNANGVVVSAINQGPALRFFKSGDIIRELNGALIVDVRQLRDALKMQDGIWDIVIERNKRPLRVRLRG